MNTGKDLREVGGGLNHTELVFLNLGQIQSQHGTEGLVGKYAILPFVVIRRTVGLGLEAVFLRCQGAFSALCSSYPVSSLGCLLSEDRVRSSQRSH